jgi:hypothetical protein
MILKQFLLWLASLWWVFLATFNLPIKGCLTGYQSAVCWRFPPYAYVVAISVFETRWATSSCIPGATYHPSQPYPRQRVWWCSAETPADQIINTAAP